jgi:hypothetical protein
MQPENILTAITTVTEALNRVIQAEGEKYANCADAVGDVLNFLYGKNRDGGSGLQAGLIETTSAAEQKQILKNSRLLSPVASMEVASKLVGAWKLAYIEKLRELEPGEWRMAVETVVDRSANER